MVEASVAAFDEPAQHGVFDTRELLQRNPSECSDYPIIVGKAGGRPLLPGTAPYQHRCPDDRIVVKSQQLGRHQPLDVQKEAVEVRAIDMRLDKRRRQVTGGLTVRRPNLSREGRVLAEKSRGLPYPANSRGSCAVLPAAALVAFGKCTAHSTPSDASRSISVSGTRVRPRTWTSLILPSLANL